jgi:hypothetical protein
MTNKGDEHQRLILEQFTKQAVPFSQMQNHSRNCSWPLPGPGQRTPCWTWLAVPA